MNYRSTDRDLEKAAAQFPDRPRATRQNDDRQDDAVSQRAASRNRRPLAGEPEPNFDERESSIWLG